MSPRPLQPPSWPQHSTEIYFPSIFCSLFTIAWQLPKLSFTVTEARRRRLVSRSDVSQSCLPPAPAAAGHPSLAGQSGGDSRCGPASLIGWPPSTPIPHWLSHHSAGRGLGPETAYLQPRNIDLNNGLCFKSPSCQARLHPSSEILI